MQGELPGPHPIFFFAPDRVTQALRGLGRSGTAGPRRRRLAPVLRVDRRVAELIHGEGFEAVQSTYLDVLEGRVGPRTAHVLTL